MTQTHDFDDSSAPPQAEAETTGGIEAELAVARAQAAEYRDNFLRAVAEADNVRKRAQRDVEAASRYAVERFAAELLDVRDSLELGTAAAGQGAGAPQLLEGMEATLRLLTKAFEKAGISAVDPLGQPFNPEYHEAMAMQPSADQPPGTVLTVVQRGYLLNGRLLRPARVLVSRPAGPAPDAG